MPGRYCPGELVDGPRSTTGEKAVSVVAGKRSCFGLPWKTSCLGADGKYMRREEPQVCMQWAATCVEGRQGVAAPEYDSEENISIEKIGQGTYSHVYKACNLDSGKIALKKVRFDNLEHRDIKGSNLLLDNLGILKIADFGLATFFCPDQNQLLTSRVVMLWYRPPEFLLGATDCGVGIDLWERAMDIANQEENGSQWQHRYNGSLGIDASIYVH
ncbi:hypothetical protein L7F22_019953 [Adiantum nelumboides]|nr:hypothetical protein [Adiantum nelumboides]